jgi:uncharacterized membrane protein YdjX (TVP38/TMEM64 family)
MPLRKAARVAAGLLLLFLLWTLVRQLPVARLVVQGAQLVQGAGLAGALCTCVAIYLLTLLLFPIVPLVVACGWLYGPWGAVLSLGAAVASAATAFSLARRFGGKAAAQALLERPKARALAELAAEGGAITVMLVRLSPLLPYTPSNAIFGLTPMRLRDVVIGTAVGMAPGALLYSWTGSLLPSPQAIEQGEVVHPGLFLLMLGSALFAATVLGIAAARRLRKTRSA